ncbi:hypothetical protein I5S84_11855 [Pseudomonas putida]|uniref:Helicase ATP-binding domain-containing protein n=1 Tax=Pseudomonas putida TaxID=303 RepID=A0ABD7BJ72_PSEPU|nr:hypothetical protein [Pseudomonas putida]MBH3449542.1 hypothetical protein [Pseudomonas putida]QOD00449.1 hypothetical protein ID616_12500 [Pseudomonas putida]
MPTLTENAATVALALAVKHISKEPILADAEVFLVGRPHLWSGWASASGVARDQIITLIKYRPIDLNQTGRFLEEVGRVMFAPGAPFRVAGIESHDDQVILPRLKETDVYCFKEGFDLEGLIEEKLRTLQTESAGATCTKWPTEGPIVLRETQPDGYRTFVISEEQRPRLKLENAALPLIDAPAVATFRWEKASLRKLAVALDQAGSDPLSPLHKSHQASLDLIVRSDEDVKADAGNFYRVNAPTGTGKTVVMGLMGIDSALQGHRVVIAVPNLTDVRNMVETLKRSVSVVAPHLKVAPLHSQRRIASAADFYLARGREDHPYDYRCLLDACATDGSVSRSDEEPCFNLQLPGERRGRETFKRIRSCPFLNQCGKRTMLEQALAADIVVVNHHALISGTTRIAVEGSGSESRSLLELLLRSASLFMVDEIDGLLLSAIDTSVFELPLSNHIEHSSLAELHMEIFGRDSIPDVDATTHYRAQRGCNAVILHTTRLLQLALKHIKWPDRETVWERAEDQMISDYLGVDRSLLDGVCGYVEQSIPQHLKPLQELLQTFSHNEAQPSPIEVVVNIGKQLADLARQKKLGQKLNEAKLEKLKSALVIRTSLHFIEDSLRTLYSDVPVLARAKVAAALRVQQDLSGSAPFSPTPLGPLQRVVYGFKRKLSGRDTWSLQVVALSGDPHRTLQYLPNLTSKIHAGVNRTFIGFSATAFFPGASCFDLSAKTLIDVPDAKGNIRFENVPVSVHVSGAGLESRLLNVRDLASELWGWLTSRLEALEADDNTRARARLLLVTGSDAEAEQLASTLHEISAGLYKVAWIRGGKKADRQERLPLANRLTYDDLVEFASGPNADVQLLVSSIYPMARGHNIVTKEAKSALGGVVVCVRPLPSSDQAANNLAHLCYRVGESVLPSASPGLALLEERAMANRILNGIRLAPPYFYSQPKAIRFYTIMNVLVTLTQLVGRARRGGTPVTCYLADAAFFDSRYTWATLLSRTIEKLKEDGHWGEFATHHAGLVEAMMLYIEASGPQKAPGTQELEGLDDEYFPED